MENKHAGKSGRCPFCKTLLAIPDPHAKSRSMLDLLDTYEEHDYVHQPPGDSASISSGLSLIGSSAVREHHKRCPVCGSEALHWHAAFPKCKTLFSGDPEFTGD